MLLRRGMSNTCKILSTRRPIIFIMGATGTGKSSLGLKLACELNGEIISADSMQVYQGLDILTNKVSKEDRMLCNHHCMDYIHPTEYSTVVSFRDKTLPIISFT
ncbi:tRNA dimethylallyltransferase, mitochondrial [Trichoplax sp. H2]|nr:tRNA dimethylallyltransferase, mitochondrial [Trichoplax sp. H2]|eukprot:RDD46206.1 tRNA dimethylallyltransferase, mitochondrial [Trichoplax sp. H2]